MLSNHPNYTTAVDMWSLGVTVHNFLFCGDDEDFSVPISEGDFSHLEGCENIGRPAKDFVKKLLCIDPQHRLTAAQAMEHPWLTVCEDALEDIYQNAIQGVSPDRRSGFGSAGHGPSSYLRTLHPPRGRKREVGQERRIHEVKRMREFNPQRGDIQDSGDVALRGLRKKLGYEYFKNFGG